MTLSAGPTATPIIQTPQPPIAGWVGTNYTYTTAHPHTVTALSGGNTASYTYDANGNMTCRVETQNSITNTYKQVYNAENRLSSVQQVATGTCASPTTYAAKWDFAGACPERAQRSRRDGDGTRVTQLYTPYVDGQPQTPVLTVYFMGGAYEVTGGAVRKYYAIAGMMVAMNDGSGLKYLLTDHLGSVVGVTDSSGTLISQQRYLPFGQIRTDVGNINQTDFGYTGQRALNMGLMDYRARMYDAVLGRFIQPDGIIPNAANPQSFNRYSYVVNRPINLNDPTGHESKASNCDYYGGAYCTTVSSINNKIGHAVPMPPMVTATGTPVPPVAPRTTTPIPSKTPTVVATIPPIISTQTPAPPPGWTPPPPSHAVSDDGWKDMIPEALPSVDSLYGFPSKVLAPGDTQAFVNALNNMEMGIRLRLGAGISEGPSLTDILYDGWIAKQIIRNGIGAVRSLINGSSNVVLPPIPQNILDPSSNPYSPYYTYPGYQ